MQAFLLILVFFLALFFSQNLLRPFSITLSALFSKPYLQENKFHQGIILTQQQKYGIGEQMRRILRLIGALSAEEMENRLEFLSVWS